MTGAARIAITEGHFRHALDPEPFRHDLYGIILAYNHAACLLRDPKADQRAQPAFEALVRAWSTPSAD